MSGGTDNQIGALQLARRWIVDYFNSHDAAAACEFITPEYVLEIGDYVFAGRDEQWLPAVAEQMRLFPGLGMTVHQVVPSTDRVAVYFSEHGASNGRTAVWSGVGIYRSRGIRLTGCVAQEDYTTRQRQLKSGQPDPVEPPAAAPWDTVPLAPDPEAEAVVQRWLAGSWPRANASVRCDDEHITGNLLRFEVTGCEVRELFSSGSDVAFHARQTGRYFGGFAGIEPDGELETLNCNGILRVRDGRVVQGRVIRDRGGLRERLLKRKKG